MPLFEHSCSTVNCSRFGRKFENYFKSVDAIAPQCPECDHITQREISTAAIVWTKPFSAYNDPSLEKASDDGYWTTRRDENNKSRPVYIDSFAAMREHARATNSHDPRDLPHNITGIDADGTKLTTTGNLAEV
jgi:hypothetical protein